MPAAPARARRRGLAAGLGLLIVLGAAPAAAAQPANAADVPNGTTGPGVSADATSGWVEGIDVSHWQGTINWSLVAGAGKKFAIIKATDGQVQSSGALFVDPMYATNHAQAKAAGLWTGAYHFARPSTNANDAVLEADHFVSVMNLGVGDLIPALDLETSGGLSVTALQAWVRAFVDRVTVKIGIKPMIYTSPAFWKKYMGDSRALADLGYKTLWIAHWDVSAPTVPAQNWGGRGWTFWQYTVADAGTVPGISTRIDLDRFNGTDLATQAYSIFKLTSAGGSVKQGASSTANVSIIRTNFREEVALSVSGLPEGTTATIGTNPTTHTSAAITLTTAADPAATPTGTYPLTITGVSAGLTKTTTANLVVTDGIGPTVTAPTTRLSTGRTLGTTTVPVRIGWTATDPSGIASTALQRSVNGGTWTTTSLPSVAALAADSTIPIAGMARQRVRATDKKANVSPWLGADAMRASVYQQTSTAVAWSGAWYTVASSGASGGSTRYSTSKYASATFTFTGSSVAWVAAKGPTRGGAWIYVDGAFAGSVSLTSATSLSRAIVFARNWSTAGPHTLKIVVAATAGHPRVDVDAFIRLTPA